MRGKQKHDNALATLLDVAPPRAVKIQRLLIEILDDMARWRVFAVKIKQDNLKRPPFQEEFAKAVPGWRDVQLVAQSNRLDPG
jgi:hypothetical protein